MDVLIWGVPLAWCLGALLRQQLALQRLQLVRTGRWRRGTLELRRRTSLERVSASDYPQPREERVVTWRLVGVPVRVRRCSVGLPLQVDACIDSLPADAYDACFSPMFRLHPGAAPR